MVPCSHGREQTVPRSGRKARARVARAEVARARKRAFVLRTYTVGRIEEGEEVAY